MVIGVFLSELHDFPIILFDFNVSNYGVVLYQYLNDTLAHLKVNFVASALLRPNKVLVKWLMVIRQDCVSARVESVKFRVIFGVLVNVVLHCDTRAMHKLSGRADFEISGAHVEHLFLQIIDQVVHTRFKMQVFASLRVDLLRGLDTFFGEILLLRISALQTDQA